MKIKTPDPSFYPSPGFVYWRLPSTKATSKQLTDQAAAAAKPEAVKAATEAAIEPKVLKITFDSDKPLKVLKATASDPGLTTSVGGKSLFFRLCFPG